MKLPQLLAACCLLLDACLGVLYILLVCVNRTALVILSRHSSAASCQTALCHDAGPIRHKKASC
jgi:hypothetical protein